MVAAACTCYLCTLLHASLPIRSTWHAVSAKELNHHEEEGNRLRLQETLLSINQLNEL